jgi:LysR family transcriptional regulator, nod-box dependent transcriptional activator
MRYQRLDLNLLTALRALLTERSVTRAAEQQCVSQSAMSGILARLREYFEDPLIQPIGRRMELTPIGESLVGKVNDLLLMIDATLGTKPEFDPAQSRRHFVFVASDYALSVLLLSMLRTIHADAPGLTIEFRQPHGLAYQSLEAGEVDFIIAPEWYLTPGFSSCPLFDDTYSVVVDRDNTEYGEAIGLEEYKAARHVTFENRGPPMFEAWFDRHHPAQRCVEIAVHSFNMLPRLVIGTRRVATMHTRLALQACEMWPVRIVRVDFEYPAFVEMLQWHHYRDHDPGLAWMREQLLRHAQALPPLPSV